MACLLKIEFVLFYSCKSGHNKLVLYRLYHCFIMKQKCFELTVAQYFKS